MVRKRTFKICETLVRRRKTSFGYLEKITIPSIEATFALTISEKEKKVSTEDELAISVPWMPIQLKMFGQSGIIVCEGRVF